MKEEQTMSQDDNTIKLQAQLDQKKSKQNINADIKTLQNQIDPVKLQVKADSKAKSGVQSLLSKIKEFSDYLRSILYITDLFSSFKNTGKRRISVRISNTVTCFEYALHA